MENNFEWNNIENEEWSRELAGRCYQQLYEKQSTVNLLVRKLRDLALEQREVELQIEQAKVLWKEELEGVVRLIGDRAILENIELYIRPKYDESTMPPHKIFVNYIKTYGMHDHQFMPHTIVEYCFLWPNCGCKMFGSLHLTGRDEEKDVVEQVKLEIGDLLGVMLRDYGEFRCPKCQVCSQELDHLCDGYEDIEPLSEFVLEQRDKDLIRRWTGRRW